MEKGRARQAVLTAGIRRRLSLARAVSLVASVGVLTLFTMPALLDQALGGTLQTLLPSAVYNAIHELRHILGMPCH